MQLMPASRIAIGPRKVCCLSGRHACTFTLWRARSFNRGVAVHPCNQGSTSFGGTYYKGPTKSGTTCTFKLYALSARLELPRAASKEDIIKAMKGKVLGEY